MIGQFGKTNKLSTYDLCPLSSSPLWTPSKFKPPHKASDGTSHFSQYREVTIQLASFIITLDISNMNVYVMFIGKIKQK